MAKHDRRLARHYIHLLLRKEIPKSKSRIENEKKERAQRLRAQQDSQVKFDSLGTSEMIAVVGLEAQGQEPLKPVVTPEPAPPKPLTETRPKSQPTRKTPIAAHSVLARVLKDKPLLNG